MWVRSTLSDGTGESFYNVPTLDDFRLSCQPPDERPATWSGHVPPIGYVRRTRSGGHRVNRCSLVIARVVVTAGHDVSTGSPPGL